MDPKSKYKYQRPGGSGRSVLNVSPWLLELVLGSTPIVQGKRLHILKSVSGPHEDGSWVKEGSDGDVSINVRFTASALKDFYSESESDSQDHTDWNRSFVILTNFQLDHHPRQHKNDCWFELTVHSFRFWANQQGCRLKRIPKFCMEIPEVRRKSDQHWMEWRMNRHSTPEALASSSQVDNDLAKSTMSSMNSLSLTQLLEQMNACSDEGGDDNGNGGKTKPVNDNSKGSVDLLKVHGGVFSPHVCLTRLRLADLPGYQRVTDLNNAIHNLSIPPSEQEVLDDIESWQSGYMPPVESLPSTDRTPSKSAKGSDLPSENRQNKDSSSRLKSLPLSSISKTEVVTRVTTESVGAQVGDSLAQDSQAPQKSSACISVQVGDSLAQDGSEDPQPSPTLRPRRSLRAEGLKRKTPSKYRTERQSSTDSMASNLAQELTQVSKGKEQGASDSCEGSYPKDLHGNGAIQNEVAGAALTQGQRIPSTSESRSTDSSAHQVTSSGDGEPFLSQTSTSRHTPLGQNTVSLSRKTRRSATKISPAIPPEDLIISRYTPLRPRGSGAKEVVLRTVNIGQVPKETAKSSHDPVPVPPNIDISGLAKDVGDYMDAVELSCGSSPDISPNRRVGISTSTKSAGTDCGVSQAQTLLRGDDMRGAASVNSEKTPVEDFISSDSQSASLQLNPPGKNNPLQNSSGDVPEKSSVRKQIHTRKSSVSPPSPLPTSSSDKSEVSSIYKESEGIILPTPPKVTRSSSRKLTKVLLGNNSTTLESSKEGEDNVGHDPTKSPSPRAKSQLSSDGESENVRRSPRTPKPTYKVKGKLPSPEARNNDDLRKKHSTLVSEKSSAASEFQYHSTQDDSSTQKPPAHDLQLSPVLPIENTSPSEPAVEKGERKELTDTNRSNFFVVEAIVHRTASPIKTQNIPPKKSFQRPTLITDLEDINPIENAPEKESVVGLTTSGRNLRRMSSRKSNELENISNSPRSARSRRSQKIVGDNLDDGSHSSKTDSLDTSYSADLSIDALNQEARNLNKSAGERVEDASGPDITPLNILTETVGDISSSSKKKNKKLSLIRKSQIINSPDMGAASQTSNIAKEAGVDTALSEEIVPPELNVPEESNTKEVQISSLKGKKGEKSISENVHDKRDIEATPTAVVSLASNDDSISKRVRKKNQLSAETRDLASPQYIAPQSPNEGPVFETPSSLGNTETKINRERESDSDGQTRTTRTLRFKKTKDFDLDSGLKVSSFYTTSSSSTPTSDTNDSAKKDKKKNSRSKRKVSSRENAEKILPTDVGQDDTFNDSSSNEQTVQELREESDSLEISKVTPISLRKKKTYKATNVQSESTSGLNMSGVTGASPDAEDNTPILKRRKGKQRRSKNVHSLDSPGAVCSISLCDLKQVQDITYQESLDLTPSSLIVRTSESNSFGSEGKETGQNALETSLPVVASTPSSENKKGRKKRGALSQELPTSEYVQESPVPKKIEASPAPTNKTDTKGESSVHDLDSSSAVERIEDLSPSHSSRRPRGEPSKSESLRKKTSLCQAARRKSFSPMVRRRSLAKRRSTLSPKSLKSAATKITSDESLLNSSPESESRLRRKAADKQISSPVPSSCASSSLHAEGNSSRIEKEPDAVHPNFDETPKPLSTRGSSSLRKKEKCLGQSIKEQALINTASPSDRNPIPDILSGGGQTSPVLSTEIDDVDEPPSANSQTHAHKKNNSTDGSHIAELQNESDKGESSELKQFTSGKMEPTSAMKCEGLPNNGKMAGEVHTYKNVKVVLTDISSMLFDIRRRARIQEKSRSEEGDALDENSGHEIKIEPEEEMESLYSLPDEGLSKILSPKVMLERLEFQSADSVRVKTMQSNFEKMMSESPSTIVISSTEESQENEVPVFIPSMDGSPTVSFRSTPPMIPSDNELPDNSSSQEPESVAIATERKVDGRRKKLTKVSPSQVDVDSPLSDARSDAEDNQSQTVTMEGSDIRFTPSNEAISTSEYSEGDPVSRRLQVRRKKKPWIIPKGQRKKMELPKRLPSETPPQKKQPLRKTKHKIISRSKKVLRKNENSDVSDKFSIKPSPKKRTSRKTSPVLSEAAESLSSVSSMEDAGNERSRRHDSPIPHPEEEELLSDANSDNPKRNFRNIRVKSRKRARALDRSFSDSDMVLSPKKKKKPVRKKSSKQNLSQGFLGYDTDTQDSETKDASLKPKKKATLVRDTESLHGSTDDDPDYEPELKNKKKPQRKKKTGEQREKKVKNDNQLVLDTKELKIGVVKDIGEGPDVNALFASTKKMKKGRKRRLFTEKLTKLGDDLADVPGEPEKDGSLSVRKRRFLSGDPSLILSPTPTADLHHTFENEGESPAQKLVSTYGSILKSRRKLIASPDTPPPSAALGKKPSDQTNEDMANTVQKTDSADVFKVASDNNTPVNEPTEVQTAGPIAEPASVDSKDAPLPFFKTNTLSATIMDGISPINIEALPPACAEATTEEANTACVEEIPAVNTDAQTESENVENRKIEECVNEGATVEMGPDDIRESILTSIEDTNLNPTVPNETVPNELLSTPSPGVDTQKSTETEITDLPNISTVAETANSTLPNISTATETDNIAIPSTSTVTETEITSLPIVSTVTETEITSLPIVSTVSETEITSLPSVSTVTETEIASLPIVSTVTETEITSLPIVSTVTETEIAAPLYISTVTETEMTALPFISTVTETAISAVPNISTATLTKNTPIPIISTALKTDTNAVLNISVSTASRTDTTVLQDISPAPETEKTDLLNISTPSGPDTNVMLNISTGPATETLDPPLIATAPRTDVSTQDQTKEVVSLVQNAKTAESPTSQDLLLVLTSSEEEKNGATAVSAETDQEKGEHEPELKGEEDEEEKVQKEDGSKLVVAQTPVNSLPSYQTLDVVDDEADGKRLKKMVEPVLNGGPTPGLDLCQLKWPQELLRRSCSYFSREKFVP